MRQRSRHCRLQRILCARERGYREVDTVRRGTGLWVKCDKGVVIAVCSGCGTLEASFVRKGTGLSRGGTPNRGDV